MQTAGTKNRQIEVRYKSAMMGTQALYDTYPTVEEATFAALDFRDRCRRNGDLDLARSIYLA